MSKLRRLNQIFAADGRAVIIALDGFAFSMNTEGIDEKTQQIDQFVHAGLDAALVTYGQAKQYEQELSNVTTILRVDANTNSYDSTVSMTNSFFDVRDALKLGASGVVCMTFPGAAMRENDTHRTLAELAHQAETWNMPVIAETLPFGYPVTSNESNDPRYIATAARLDVELGADIIKTRFSGQKEDLLIVENANRPVLALGGPKADHLTYFKFVQHCIKVGACGVAVGRNIVQDPNPMGMIAALHALVHDEVDANHALEMYQNSNH